MSDPWTIVKTDSQGHRLPCGSQPLTGAAQGLGRGRHPADTEGIDELIRIAPQGSIPLKVTWHVSPKDKLVPSALIYPGLPSPPSVKNTILNACGFPVYIKSPPSRVSVYSCTSCALVSGQ